jgi:hypothetical protein
MDRQMHTDPHQGRPPTAREQRPSGAVSARDSGLRRIGRFNRWLVGGAVGLTAFFSAVAALAHPGSSRTGAAAASAPSTATNAPPATDTTQSPAPAASPVDPSTATDNSQPLPPPAAPQVDPTASAPPVATSGGS